MRLENYINQLNTWGQHKVPFLFLIDFELEKPRAWLPHQVTPDEMLYDVNGFSNAPTNKRIARLISIDKQSHYTGGISAEIQSGV